MSNGINSYHQHRYNVTLKHTGPARSVVPAATPEPAAPANRTSQAAAPATGLSGAEQQMIDRYFPSSEQMALRLYGPGQGARTMNPARLGGRLDLQG